jgi:hypothetical protein
LKEELVKLSSDIIASRGLTEVPDLYEQARALYEKLAVLKFIEEKLSDVQVDVSKSEVASKFESIASAVINENRQVPENSPHEEDIIIPGMDTIKHMVSEMPGGEELEEVLQRLIGKNEFVKNDAEEVTPKKEDIKKTAPAKSLNDTLTAKEIAVGLNDRLAFVKHLFDDNAEAFGQTMARLNTLESQEHSLTYIEREVKPVFNHWEGKDEYATRFIALIQRRFN